MQRQGHSPKALSMDRVDLWSTATAATPFDAAAATPFDPFAAPLSPRITGPKPSGAALNPFDDLAALNPPSPKRQDPNPLSPRRNSFQLGQHQGLRGHLQQFSNSMYLPPRPPQHAFNFSSTPGFPAAQPAAAFQAPAATAAIATADAFDPFNPAAAAAFSSPDTQQQQRRGSGAHQRRGSESHRLSEEIAFDPFALDALSAAVPVEDEEVKEVMPEADAEVSSQGRPSEQDDIPQVDAHALLSMREQQLVSGERYTVVYPSKTRLGLLLERKDEWVPGCAQRAERAVVRMVVAGTESEIRGVTAGSKVVAVNGQSMLSVPYSDVLDTVRKAPRPVTIEFERAPPVTPNDEVSGEGFYKISRSPYAPSTMAEWEPMYFVIGGPIAKANVLQVYGSKQDFEDTVVALFRKEKITAHVQVFKLDMQCKLSVIKEKRYGAQVVRFFWLKPPTYKFKSIKIGVTRDFEQLRKLHAQMSRFTTAA